MNLIDYIRNAASIRGIDPNIAVRVAQSEGGTSGFVQSGYSKNGIREPSYGPFQLLVGGPGTGYPTGLGNAFEKQTGLSASDPANVYAGIDFALDNAKKSGWSRWYGAAKSGISKWAGINKSGNEPLFLDENGRGVGEGGNIVSTPDMYWTDGDNSKPGPLDLGTLHVGNKNITGDKSQSPGDIIEMFTGDDEKKQEGSGSGGWGFADLFGNYFLRAIIIILGFIFVAVGLVMFKPGIAPAPIQNVAKKLR